MQSRFTRRTVVKGALVAGAVVSTLDLIGNAVSAAAAGPPPLDPSEPAAVTLGFINDTSKVDAAANPTHTANQTCGNCEQFVGNQGAPRGGCVLFPGRSVPAIGWCKVWRKTTKV
jgi:high potential iron-sulfur protein